MADMDEIDPAMRGLLKKRPTMQKMAAGGASGSRAVRITGTKAASLRELVSPSTVRAAGNTTMTAALQQREMSRKVSDGRAKATVPVKLHHSFGTPSVLGAFLVEEDVVLHPTGRHLVSHDLAKQTMNFLHDFPADVERISAIALIGNRKYVAFCEVFADDPRPQVRIMHLASRRAVSTLTAEVDGPFVGCCFSDDGKYLLAYTADPDHFVVVWHWVEERPVGMMRSRTHLPQREPP